MPEDVDVLKEFKTITDLLLFLRKTGKLLGVKIDEQEKLKLEMKRITQVINHLILYKILKADDAILVGNCCILVNRLSSVNETEETIQKKQ